MIPVNFAYVKPKDLTGLFEEIQQENFMFLAGGTDVLVLLREEKVSPEKLVDLKAVPELQGIEKRGSQLWIGAAETIQAVAEHPLTQPYTALVQGASSLACYELRLRATLGGNLANGSPSADSVPGLLLYEAQVCIASAKTQKTMPLCDFLLGPGKVALERDEVLLGVLLPEASEGSSSRYYRATRVKGMDLSGISVATYCEGLQNVRIALGAVWPTVARAGKAEEVINKAGLSQESLESGLAALLEDVNPRRSSLRATPEYKKAMVRELIVKGLNDMTGGHFHV